MKRAGRSSLKIEIGAGVVFAVGLGALPAAVVGLDFAWLVVIASASVLVLAPLIARRQVHRIEVRSVPESIVVHAGRPTPFPVKLTSPITGRDLLLHVASPVEPSRERHSPPRVAVTELPGGLEHTIPVPVRFPERGRWAGPRLQIKSSFPFALFSATRTFPLDTKVTVLPRLLPRVDPVLKQLFSRAAAGVDAENASPRRGARGLPAEIRPARHGDTARDIAWRASVRAQRWMAVERASATRERRVDIVLARTVRGATASSLRRSALAFEAAIAHCATTTEWLTRESGLLSLWFDPPIQTNETAAPEVRSGRSLDHLEALAVVQRPDRPTSARDGEESPPLDAALTSAQAPTRIDSDRIRITFLPMAALEFQRAVEEWMLRTTPADEDVSCHIVLGVESNGRMVPVHANRAFTPPASETT